MTEQIPPSEEMRKALRREMEATLLTRFRVCVRDDGRREVDKIGSESFVRIPFNPLYLLKPLDCLWRSKSDGMVGKEVEEAALSHRGFALAAALARVVTTSTLKLERKAYANTPSEIGASLVQASIQQTWQFFCLLSAINVRVMLVSSSAWIQECSQTA